MIVKIEGVDVTDKVKKDSVSITRGKNRSLALQMFYKSGFPSIGQDIEVLEGTDVYFGGIIKKISHIPVDRSYGSGKLIELSISSDGYNSIAQRRTIQVYYIDVTAGSIVNEMISSFLIDEGVTAGTISTGATIREYAFPVVSIKQVLDDMAEASGYEWEIDDNKQLNFQAVDTVASSGNTLTEGDTTYYNFQLHEDLGQYRNKQFVVGGKADDGSTITVAVEDTTEISNRATAEGNSGVYGHVIQDDEITNDTDATAVATEALNRYIDTKKVSFTSHIRYELFKTLSINYPKFSLSNDFLITKENIRRRGHAWEYSYFLELRSTSSFSKKAKDDAVDFFKKMSGSSSNSLVKLGEHDIFVQNTEPTAAESKSLWIDTDDFTNYDVQEINTETTLTLNDKKLIFASGAITITLPEIASALHKKGIKYVIINTGTGTVTIDGGLSETINGNASVDIEAGNSLVIVSDGTNWKTITSGSSSTGYGSATTYTSSGAISLDDSLVLLDSSSNVLSMTLADGTEGQEIKIQCIDNTNAITVTPSNFGSQKITFDTVGESAILAFDGLRWRIIKNLTTTEESIEVEKTVTIDYTKVDADLTDYPVMVKLDSSNWDFGDFQIDGSDIYFRDSGDTGDLKFEREHYNATEQKAVFWVKIPSVSSTANTQFLIKNNSPTDKEDAANVWDSNFVGVWHLGTSLNDSTSNNNDGVNHGTTEVDGLNGKARSFDGINNYVSAGISNFNTFTISGIFKTDTDFATEDQSNGDARPFVNKSDTTDGFFFGSILDSGKLRFGTSHGNIQTVQSSWLTTLYYDFAITQSGSTGEIFIDGESDISGNNGYVTYDDVDLEIGARTVASGYFKGTMEEVRVSNIVRSGAWQKTDDYNYRLNNLISIS